MKPTDYISHSPSKHRDGIKVWLKNAFLDLKVQTQDKEINFGGGKKWQSWLTTSSELSMMSIIVLAFLSYNPYFPNLLV